MPLERKTYDGDIPGSSTVAARGGDPITDESEIGEHAAAERAKRYDRYLEADAELFEESSETDRYLITYADLITLLLGLFIILYSISKIDMQKYEDLVYAMGDIFGTEKSAKGDSLALLSNKISTLGGAGSVEQIRKDVTELIEEFHYDHSISLEENERGLTIRILEDILFPSGEARLNESSKDVLVKLAHIIKKLPNDIRVEGHTDNVPISTPVYPSNWHLSVNRALNTAYFLIESVDISADKVSIVGYSEYKPIAQNDTREGRAINRRVDIVIIK